MGKSAILIRLLNRLLLFYDNPICFCFFIFTAQTESGHSRLVVMTVNADLCEWCGPCVTFFSSVMSNFGFFSKYTTSTNMHQKLYAHTFG